MIPDALWSEWLAAQDRTETLFLADHGGGKPDCLIGSGLKPEDRLHTLRRLGFRVAERYEMPGAIWNDLQPWARLTNDIAVCLADGFVVRANSGGRLRK